MKKLLRILISRILGALYRMFYILPLDWYFNVKSSLGLFKIQEYDGGQKFGRKICIFVSYPAQGKISHLLLRYIENLQDLGYSIVFILNRSVVEEHLKLLKPLCTKVIIRENFGLDFGAYKFGILRYKDQIKKSNELLVANDSVIAIARLDKMFDDMKKTKADFWGVTESYLRSLFSEYGIHHICSWFMFCSKNIIESEIFWNFWESYKVTNSRFWTIYNGEVYLSYYIRKNNFKIKSYINSVGIASFLKKKHSSNILNYLNTYLVNLFFTGGTIKTRAGEVIVKFLYSSNQYVMFLKVMLELGMPFVKKDSFSKCNYFAYEIYEILDKKNIQFKEEIIDELLLRTQAPNSLKNTLLRLIGEK